MKKFIFIIIIAAGVLAALVGIFSVYMVDETNQAIVKEFGKIKYVRTEPGLYFKLPWRSVNFYDKRILSHTSGPMEAITKDKKQVIINSYVCWIIEDVALFEASLGSVENARNIMHEIIVSEHRAQIGSSYFTDIITSRDKILSNVIKNSDEKFNKMGINLIDVRIKKMGLTDKNFASIAKRMVAEKETIASRYRAEGQQQAIEIQSYANRVSDSLIQAANREATIIKARADSTALSIYNEKLGHDRDFFDFVMTLEMYKNTMDTAKVLVIPNNSAIYRLLTTGRL